MFCGASSSRVRVSYHGRSLVRLSVFGCSESIMLKANLWLVYCLEFTPTIQALSRTALELWWFCANLLTIGLWQHETNKGAR